MESTKQDIMKQLDIDEFTYAMIQESKELPNQKAEFVEMIGELLAYDPKSHVIACKYYSEGELFKCDTVVIYYKGGAEVKINVNINSNGATCREIINEVYGAGAGGRYE